MRALRLSAATLGCSTGSSSMPSAVWALFDHDIAGIKFIMLYENRAFNRGAIANALLDEMV
jgi:hypothetical protein